MNHRQHRADGERKLVAKRDVKQDSKHGQQRRDDGRPLDLGADDGSDLVKSDPNELRLLKLLLERLFNFDACVKLRGDQQSLFASDVLLILDHWVAHMDGRGGRI